MHLGNSWLSRVFAVALCLLGLAAPVRAQSWLDWSRATESDSLGLVVPADAIMIGSSFLLWGGSQLLRSSIAPASCRLCDGSDNRGLPSDAGDGRGSLNRVDAYFHDALAGRFVSRKTADTTSNVIAYGAVPVFALAGAIFATGPHASDWAGARTTVILLESVALNGAIGQAMKFGFARKRPFIRYGHGTDGATSSEGSTYDATDPDSHFSFVSGHTSETTSLAFGVAMCATLDDSKAAPYLWAGAGTLTALVGTLRMVAEKHYFTDVVGGAALGAAVGVLVPLLHRTGSWLGGERDASGLRLSVIGTDGAQIAWAGTF